MNYYSEKQAKIYLKLLSLRKSIFHFLLISWSIGTQVSSAALRYLKLALFYQRRDVIINFLAEKQPPPKEKAKILAAIAHITSIEEAQSREKAAAKIEKLKNTIDGILNSFAQCEISIVIKTVPGRHITAYLPEYQLNYIQVQEEANCDPMFIGFTAQDEFSRRINDFDWFLFIEDDIIIYDGCFLEKLEKFNANCGYEWAILLPNRYEFWQGQKKYIDLSIDRKLSWNSVTSISIEGIKFAECSNPHSGLYCLSKKQMKHWMESAREWKNKVLMVGPLESAATFCLLESFSLYKPHPSNLHFFEVRHYDTKYSELFPERAHYTFSPMKSTNLK